jgi:hypothetical protein
MKLSRARLRRLIESVVNEQSADGPEYSIPKIEEFDDLIKTYAKSLLIAMHGLGHDGTVIGRITKRVTGAGTDETTIENVFRGINNLSESDLAQHYQAHGKLSSDLTYSVIGNDGRGILQMVAIEYQNISGGERLKDALESELTPDEQEVLFSIINNYHEALIAIR